MIELYIENKKIDITDDLEINFTYESIDPDKLSSIKNSFSKTVNIPGTAANNITFGHIFRSDKHIPAKTTKNIDSYYDPHKKVNWFINRNGVLVNRGYCTLDNIVMKSKRDITYQLTLYGGIGEFFYSLSYNEDGSPKTLYDMFWNWYPKTGIIGHGPATDTDTENNTTLFKLSADIVASCWHGLNPLYTYEGTTYIDKDVTLIPCYTGLYEDFDSKHMLVSTFNQHYNPGYDIMPTETKNSLIRAFPDSYIDYSEGQGTEYTTLNNTFSSTGGYKYGLVTFSRDVDPWEAGDLRVNELPVAIRLSKLMTVISNYKNNGGYNVIWDDEIKQSYHWLYGWIMLGKLNQENESFSVLTFTPNQQYDGQNSIIDVEWNGNTGPATAQDVSSYFIDSNMSEIGTVKAGKYYMYINVLPRLVVNCRGNFSNWPGNNMLVSGSWKSSDYSSSPHSFLWTTSVLVHKIYDGNTLIKTIADVFYYTGDPDILYFGLNNKGISVSDIKQVLSGRINQRFMNQGEFIDEYRYHDCKISGVEVTVAGGNSTASISCDSQKISTTLTLPTDVTNLRVEQYQGLMWTRIGTGIQFVEAGRYGVDNIDFVYEDFGLIASSTAPVGFGMKQPNNAYVWWTSEWPWPSPASSNHTVSFGFNMNEGRQNGLLSAKNSGFNILNLDKKTLFAGSDSPMMYLSGYCKMMNYRFLCDETSKTIYIKTLKNYYNGNVRSLDERVDIGRDINIKNILTKYKTINIGLNTPETYPVSIFDRISREKFNTKKKDTGIQYNAGETSLLKDLIYENTIDWQQNSVYYNINPQLPRAYNVQSVSWTLFNEDSANTDNIKKKEIFTVGTPSNDTSLLATADFLPKVSLFDKDNKYVDFSSSLIFLNGFVKNYDYSEISTTTKRELTPDSTNPSHYINTSGVVTSSQYQDIYIYNVQSNTQYFVTASYPSTFGSNVVNYYNASGTRIGTEYPQASANLVDAPLTIPSGTATIRCNFRKADTTAVLKAVGPYFVISPKVSLSNDMYEQYYLNQARCYMYDFKYNDNFTSWGCYSTDQKGSAASWVLPMFSRDLYNVYVPDIMAWNSAAYNLASWNIVEQDGLNDMYNLRGTEFVYNPNYEYQKTVSNNAFEQNEYSFNNVPADEPGYTDRIYSNNWEDYLNDLYDRNARDVTAYVNLSGFGDANTIMRGIYSWDSHLWIITKIYNYRLNDITNDKFTKVKMHKINKLSTWTN